MSHTFFSNSGGNLSVLSSFSSLSENRLSWSADVPLKKPEPQFHKICQILAQLQCAMFITCIGHLWFSTILNPEATLAVFANKAGAKILTRIAERRVFSFCSRLSVLQPVVFEATCRATSMMEGKRLVGIA
jgi:hypothetical protein